MVLGHPIGIKTLRGKSRTRRQRRGGTPRRLDFRKNRTARRTIQCPEGHLAVYDGFDTETMTVEYEGDAAHCNSFLRWGTYDKRFEFSFEKNPQFFGPIAQGSKLAEACITFRKQVELNFALESNLLDSVLHHKKLTVRGQKRAETFLRLTDLSRLILGMIHHARDNFVPKGRYQELRRLAEQAIYDRKSVLLRTA